MAVKKKNSSRWIMIVSSILLITAFGFFTWKSFITIEEQLFSKNPRFVVKHIEVTSPGWWNKRSDTISKRFNIHPEKTNLFELEPASMRQTLIYAPEIRIASVTRVLPDTLKIAIEERIPRARLLTKDTKSAIKTTPSGKRYRSIDYKWVVDKTGVVMPIDSCLEMSKGLPIIDYRTSDEKINPGMVLPKIKPALELVLLAKQSYHALDITEILFANEHSLKFKVSLRKNRKYTYIVEDMPYDNLDKNMKILKEAIIGELKNRNYMPKVRVDIEGQVIWSK